MALEFDHPGAQPRLRAPVGERRPADTLAPPSPAAAAALEGEIDRSRDRREAEHNEVDYVQRRHVRKPRGAPPGTVFVERARTLSVRRDPDRRARLQAARERPDADSDMT